MPEDMQKTLGWIVAALGLVALVLAGLWLGRSETVEAEEDSGFTFFVPVTLTAIERGDLDPVAQLSGTVRAARRARLGFDTRGLIQSLDVREADAVSAGQVLARLHRGDEEHELAAAQASLRLAERQYELLLAGERGEEKRRLAAVLEAVSAEAELARLEVERGNKMLADRIISQSELDQRRTTLDAADQRRAAAEEEYAQAIAGTRPEELAVARARSEEAQARWTPPSTPCTRPSSSRPGTGRWWSASSPPGITSPMATRCSSWWISRTSRCTSRCPAGSRPASVDPLARPLSRSPSTPTS